MLIGGTFYNWNSIELFPGLILFFIILSTFIERIAVPLNKGHLSLTFAFSLCAFYVFGNVIIPIWIMSIGVVVTLLVFHKRTIEDTLFNVGIITTSTIAGGLVYSALGGQWHANNFDFISLSIMILAISVTNQTILTIHFYNIDKKVSMQDRLKDFTWDLSSYLITVPLGFLMAILFNQIGFGGVLLIFVPLATTSYVFRLYKKVEQFNTQLNGLSKIAHEINDNIDFETTLKNIGEQCTEVMHLDAFYLLLAENKELKPVYTKGDMKGYLEKENLQFGQGASGHCAETKQTVLILDTIKDERIFTSGSVKTPGSIIAIPLMKRDQLIGVMTGVKKGKNSFQENEVKIFELMAYQASVALANAQAFKEVEDRAIIDELTKVYNYRYFQQRVQQEVQRAALEGTNLSLMVLDLDDFKQVNDVHGHTVGNSVLIELAQVLRKSVRKYDVIFRYGGDEFVVVFPQTDKQVAHTIGKRILENVASTPFKCSEGLEETLTFSAGIAEFPIDADDHLDLMRKADRIMYVGSKEKGKNKITLYGT